MIIVILFNCSFIKLKYTEGYVEKVMRLCVPLEDATMKKCIPFPCGTNNLRFYSIIVLQCWPVSSE